MTENKIAKDLAKIGAMFLYGPSRAPHGEVIFAKLPKPMQAKVWPVMHQADRMWDLAHTRGYTRDQKYAFLQAHYNLVKSALDLLGLKSSRFCFSEEPVPKRNPVRKKA